MISSRDDPEPRPREHGRPWQEPCAALHRRDPRTVRSCRIRAGHRDSAPGHFGGAPAAPGCGRGRQRGRGSGFVAARPGAEAVRRHARAPGPEPVRGLPAPHRRTEARRIPGWWGRFSPVPLSSGRTSDLSVSAFAAAARRAAINAAPWRLMQQRKDGSKPVAITRRHIPQRSARRGSQACCQSRRHSCFRDACRHLCPSSWIWN